MGTFKIEHNVIGDEIFDDNIHESTTLIPEVESLADRLGFDHPVVITDVGLLSKRNIDALKNAEYQYIFRCKTEERQCGCEGWNRHKDWRRVVVSMSDAKLEIIQITDKMRSPQFL